MLRAISHSTFCALLLFGMQSTSLAGHIYSTIQGASETRIVHSGASPSTSSTTPSAMFGANLDGSNVRVRGAGGAAGIALDTRGGPDTPCPPVVPATSGAGLVALVLGLLAFATTTLIHR